MFRGFLAEKEEGAGKGTPRIFRGECEADANVFSSRHEPGVWKLRYRRKIEVLGVKGEWREREREGGWILNRPSTYRGMKTANGEGSKLKKKKGKK